MTAPANLNKKPLSKCFAFELRIIIENRLEDGMSGSVTRRALALRTLLDRATNADKEARDELLALVKASA